MNLNGLRSIIGSFRGFGADTAFVLAALGLELGRTLQYIDTAAQLLIATAAMVAVLPYYLPSEHGRPTIAKWLAIRGLLAVVSVAAGTALVNAGLFEAWHFVPFSLLIVAAMTSCFIRFYALIRLSLAK